MHRLGECIAAGPLRFAFMTIVTWLCLSAAPFANAEAASSFPNTHFGVPVFLDHDQLGEIDGAFTAANELISLDGNLLLDWLKAVVLPKKLAELRLLIRSDGRLILSSFGASGIGLEYDA